MWHAIRQLFIRLRWLKVPTLREQRIRVREATFASQNWGKIMESRRWEPIHEGFQRKILVKDSKSHHDFYLVHVCFHPGTADVREFGHTPWIEELHGDKPKATPKPIQPVIEPVDPFNL